MTDSMVGAGRYMLEHWQGFTVLGVLLFASCFMSQTYDS